MHNNPPSTRRLARRSSIRGLFCLLIIVAVFACGKEDQSTPDKVSGQQGVESAHRGGRYRIPLLNSPSTLDPPYVQDIYGASVVQQLFDGLVRFSPDLILIPDLAETWQVEDNGKTYRFTLRRDATFHNGLKVTPEDVVFSLSRIMRIKPEPFILPHILKIQGAEEYRKGNLDRVTGLEVADDRTIIIHLKEPYAPFLVTLGMYQAKVVPRAVVAGDEKAFARKPVGSGPFRFVAWEQDKAIRLGRFDHYFAGPALLDEIVFKIYPGGKVEEVLADFLRGDLEEMPVYGSIRDQLRGKKGLTWLHRPSLSLLFYGFNCRRPLLQNKEVRKALSAVVDRQALVDQVYGGQFEPARTILPPGMPGYQPQGEKAETAGSSARQLIKSFSAQAGGGPVTIEVVTGSTSPQCKAELQFIKKAWAPLGVELKPKFIRDWAQFENYISSDAVQVYRYVWFADIPHPDNFLHPLFGSSSVTNFMKYRNEMVDRMLTQAITLTDPVQRAQMYHEIENRILDDSPLMPLFYLTNDRVYKSYVKGVEVCALGAVYTSFYRAYLVAPAAQ